MDYKEGLLKNKESELYKELETKVIAQASKVHNNRYDYSLVDYVNKQFRENRFKYRKDVLIKEGYDSTKTEHQIMKERGINRIYDCGSKKYVLTFNYLQIFIYKI